MSIQTSWEIGGGSVGTISIMNEIRDEDGELKESWVEVIPTSRFFTATKAFGRLVSHFSPQSEDTWDDLNPSTKQNCSFLWADNIQDLKVLWNNEVDYLMDCGY